MIDRAALPSISHILSDMDIPANRHGRTKCPIHLGDNNQAFSYNDQKGVWYCFRCGIGGDAIDLVKKAQGVDFVGALRWLGLSPDFIKAPDPAIVRRHRMRANLQRWAKIAAKKLRFEFYVREQAETRAQVRLKRDPDDPQAWDWLEWAYKGKEAAAYHLDMLEGTEQQQIEMFKQRGAAA